jgi:hypothetical protein
MNVILNIVNFPYPFPVVVITGTLLLHRWARYKELVSNIGWSLYLRPTVKQSHAALTHFVNIRFTVAAVIAASMASHL